MVETEYPFSYRVTRCNTATLDAHQCYPNRVFTVGDVVNSLDAHRIAEQCCWAVLHCVVDVFDRVGDADYNGNVVELFFARAASVRTVNTTNHPGLECEHRRNTHWSR
jgi:hypothetical protein